MLRHSFGSSGLRFVGLAGLDFRDVLAGREPRGGLDIRTDRSFRAFIFLSNFNSSAANKNKAAKNQGNKFFHCNR